MISEKTKDHLAGTHVVVKSTYLNESRDGTATVCLSIPTDAEYEAWQDAAFTNGGALVKVELIWSPEERANLEKNCGEASEEEA